MGSNRFVQANATLSYAFNHRLPTVRDGDAQDNETIVLDETDNAVVSDTISPLSGPIRD